MNTAVPQSAKSRIHHSHPHRVCCLTQTIGSSYMLLSRQLLTAYVDALSYRLRIARKRFVHLESPNHRLVTNRAFAQWFCCIAAGEKKHWFGCCPVCLESGKFSLQMGIKETRGAINMTTKIALDRQHTLLERLGVIL